MILAVDVQYRGVTATAAGVIFPSWGSREPVDELVVAIETDSKNKSKWG